MKKNRIPMRAKTAEQYLLDLLTVESGRGSRPLTDDERRLLVTMLNVKRDPLALDIERLVPEGSYLKRVQRHFLDTDISFALPIFQTVMLAASWLTQNDAKLVIPGVGEVLPTLWTVALAESGSAKTLATTRMTAILGDGHGTPPVRILPNPGSDAQWIADLAENNGAFWFQDEVGKFFANVLRNKLFSRIKPWMLNAYSHEPIGNRLRGDVRKLEIAKPAFTFFGLSVLSTWREDVDAVSMLDGFCQRPNYVIATAREGTSMFDHFIYFEGEHVASREDDLRELWQALCAQPGAADAYTLNPEVLPYLRHWWSGLRHTWGSGGVPASFVRRVGFSVLRYLMVLQFLLGKSRYPIDLETAHLATRFAEYHLESTREMLQAYDRRSVEQVQKVAELRDAIAADGQAVTARTIQRRLGKAMRKGLSTKVIDAIIGCLSKVELGEDFLATSDDDPRARSTAIVARLEQLESRLLHNERKRNERRLRELRRAHAAVIGAHLPSVDDSVVRGKPEATITPLPSLATGISADEGDSDVWFDQTFGAACSDGAGQRAATILPFTSR